MYSQEVDRSKVEEETTPCEDLEEIQVRYEVTLRKVRKYYSLYPETLARFNKSQEAYDKFIALEMEAVWDQEQVDGLGTGNRWCPCVLETELWLTRLLMLYKWEQGIAEDDCPGARRTKSEME